MVAIVDNRIPNTSLSRLREFGFDVMSLPCADHLAEPVSAHPDMLIFMGFGKLFCHSEYFERNAELISRLATLSGLEMCLSDEKTDKEYPLDVLFNCVAIGNNLLCNTKTVSKTVLCEAQSRGMKILHTNQGYSKCSVCKVSENAVITSDNSIARVCTENGIDVLIINEGNVALAGYDHGFIGGASGSDGKNIYFCGDITRHPNAENIVDFCRKHGKNAVSLSDEPLYDIGSVFFI